MNDLTSALEQLAVLNYSGAVFLLAYGLTWLICGWLWKVLPPNRAVYATLFQGVIALPAALAVSYGLGMFDERPGGEMITQLSVLVAMSQLLILPLLIVLVVKAHHTVVPLIFSFAGAIHFVPYAWLYQTSVYIVMPLVLVAILTVLYAKDTVPKGQFMSRRLAGMVCLVTGGLFVATGTALVLIHS